MPLLPDHLAAFLLAAGLLTVTPGLDTALVLRTAAADGPRSALLAALGVVTGCLGWGLIVAAGLGALLAASTLAYDALRLGGAAYLVCLGIGLLLRPRRGFEAEAPQRQGTSGPRAFTRGFLTNMLNPKVGVFYVSFLPQFVPAGVEVALVTVLLAALHAAMGLGWFALLVGALRPVVAVLRRDGVVTWLDRVTGGVFLVFGLKLAVGEHR